MKRAIKYFLARRGLWQTLDLVRQVPELLRWIASGCKGVAPPPLKRRVIEAYLDSYHLRQFVETGTYLGDTLSCIARRGNVECTSVELADEYYEAAKKRFPSNANVTLIQGDSGAVLPIVVSALKESALFWLDGHYSGGNTAQGRADTPVSSELRAILDSAIKTHVILIDDARCFDGTHSYPELGTLISAVRETSAYEVEVSADIIRLTPKHR